MDEESWGRLITVEPIVRRVLRTRVAPSALDDLVQETLEQLSASAKELSADQLASYAATSAIHSAASFHRTNARHRRLETGMIDLSDHDGPEARMVADEEATTLRRAMAGMDPNDRDLLEAHHVHDASLASLARVTGRSEMAVRLSLARARAKLRVDYTLARHEVDPPTARCRSVLLALSSGDRRAQQRLDADDHLERCPVCADLIAPATGRHRPAVGILALLAWRWRQSSATARRGVSIGGAAAGVVAVALVATVAVSRPDEPVQQAVAAASTTATPVTAAPTPTTPASVRTDPDGEPLASSAAGLRAATGRGVTGDSVRVLEVPADEGFWIAADDGGAIWVQLVDTGGESPIRIQQGDAVTFTGSVQPHDAGLVISSGSTGAAAERLTTQGHHLQVMTSEIRIG